MAPYAIFFNFLEERAVEWNTENLRNKMNKTVKNVIFLQRRVRSNL